MTWARSIRTKMILGLMTSILIISLSIIVITYFSSKNYLIKSAQEKLESDLQLGYAYLDQKYPGPWEIKQGDLYKGNEKINGNFFIVDEIGTMTGGDTVTLFQGETRVTTNVKNEDGSRAVGTKVSETVAQRIFEQKQRYVGRANVVGNWNQTAYEPITDAKGETIGIWYVGVPEKTYLALAKSMMFESLWIVVGLSVIIISFGFWFLRKTIGTPLELLQTEFSKLADSHGDLTKEICFNSNDEIGDLAQSVNKFLVNLREIMSNIRLESLRLAQISQDLSYVAHITEKTSDTIACTMHESTISASSQSEYANNILKMMTDARRIIQLGQQEIISSVTSASESTQSTQKGCLIINDAHDHLNELTETVQIATSTMNRLHSYSEEISKIVTMISDIANQTNLLSFNAAIEAARAGEKGKGFSIVAEEVRLLAEDSKKSSAQIERIIVRIKSETSQALQSIQDSLIAVEQQAEFINRIGRSLTDIDRTVRRTESDAKRIQQFFASLLATTEQVENAIQAITTNLEEAVSASEEVSSSVTEQSSMVDDIAHRSEDLSLLATKLQHQISGFKLN
ncbi:methyl-accepting chemotaxis protein [Heliobacterium chlorum]|uniref:Methyl-accepting chemotaxis protein n=1 Tax=Heliobacterium chlorum TaxID=2698 RepID=A0ABR7T434_HELCL|nr:methyl-accepting chemotaxis protein [Heliobacterium chlorum]MBC9784735.1 methyl-accepting chemotaxis protein [Heliobacterium chlorum]